MTIDGREQRGDAYEWYIEEWRKGNRVKASKIMRVHEKMWKLYCKWFDKNKRR